MSEVPLCKVDAHAWKVTVRSFTRTVEVMGAMAFQGPPLEPISPEAGPSRTRFSQIALNDFAPSCAAQNPQPSAWNSKPETRNRKPRTLQGYLAHKETPTPLGPP